MPFDQRNGLCDICFHELISHSFSIKDSGRCWRKQYCGCTGIHCRCNYKGNPLKRNGTHWFSFWVGICVHSLIGGFLSKLGYMETGLAAASFSFIAFIVTMILLPESHLDRSKYVETKRRIFNIDAVLKAFKNPNLAILISLFFILTFSFANIYGTFALLGLQVYGLLIFRMDICLESLGFLPHWCRED